MLTVRLTLLIVLAATLAAGCQTGPFKDLGATRYAGKPYLEEGVQHYEEGNYRLAKAPSVRAGGRLEPPDRVQAHKYLAFIACVSSQPRLPRGIHDRSGTGSEVRTCARGGRPPDLGSDVQERQGETGQEAMMEAASVTMLGRYEIISELGQGAMGVVYKARDPMLDRVVAIKTIHLTLPKEELAEYEARFYQEAKAAGGLSHRNIVTIYDIGRSERVAYMADGISGRPELRKLMQARTPDPHRTRARYRRAGRRRTAIRARPADHPSRYQAREHHDTQRWTGQNHRLRHCAHAQQRGQDHDRHDPGFPQVHVPGTGFRQARGYALRHFFAGRGALRNADRHVPLRLGQHPWRDVPDHNSAAGAQNANPDLPDVLNFIVAALAKNLTIVTRRQDLAHDLRQALGAVG
jgi:hypothetical protein